MDRKYLRCPCQKAVFGYVSIDSIAGPSEILVLADETANPRYVAADLLSQAEHDEMASAILITTSEELAKKVSEEVDNFVEVLSRKEIIEKSLENYGYILVAEDMDEAIDAVNDIASEHMEIVTRDPFSVMTKSKMQEQSLSESTHQSLWETILQDQTMFCLQTEQQNSSQPYL